MNIRHILLTSDLSDESQRAFEPAAAMAREHGAKITILHVVQDVAIAPHGAPLAPPISPPDLGSIIDAAKERLAAQCATFADDIDVHCEVITAPEIAESTSDYAKEHNCDMIMLSTHGRSGFRRFVLGSVAEAILRHAHVPVLCFPRAE